MPTDGFVVPSNAADRSRIKPHQWSTAVARSGRSGAASDPHAMTDITVGIQNMSLADGKFEVRIPVKAIPNGEVTFWRNGYIIGVLVVANPSTGSRSATTAGRLPYHAEFKLPLFVRPETVSVDRPPVGDHFRVRAEIVNSRYRRSKTKRPAKKRSNGLTNVIYVHNPDQTRIRRCYSWNNLQKSPYAADGLPADAAAGQKNAAIKRRHSLFANRISKIGIPEDLALDYESPTVAEVDKTSKLRCRQSTFARLLRTRSGTGLAPSALPGASSTSTGDGGGGGDGEEEASASGVSLKRSSSASVLLNDLSTNQRSVQLTTSAARSRDVY